MKELEEQLNAHLKHSKSLNEISLNLSTKPLKCGFSSFEDNDYLVEGEGNLLIISAKPGHGKTALSTNIGLNVASYGRVLYFSLEMSARALKKRIVGIESGVPIKKLAEPVFAKKVADAIDRLSRLQFDIVDDKDLTLNSIISKTHDENNRGKLSLVIVDYIGIIDYAGKTRHEAIADAAKRFKDEVADKLKIPVIVLAQMKNGFDERYAKAKMEYEKAKQYPTGANKDIMNIRPSLEDIGESSGIGKAADVVMFLHRPCLLDPTEPTSLFKVYVAKAREGEPKDFQLEFSSSLTKFIDRNNSI